MRQRRHDARAFLAIAAAGTTFMLLRLFAGGTIGMSDQGDGTRLLCSLGLRQGNPYNAPTVEYLYPVWYDHTWYGEDCGATGTGEPYHSTQLWFAGLAKGLTHALTATDGLDLRVLGALFSLVVGLLVAAIAVTVPGARVSRALVAAGLLLVLGDGAFAGYFVSAYSEPAGFAGLLLLVLAVLVHVRGERVTWRSLAFLGVATMVTVAAKTQTASLLPSVVLVLLARPSRPDGATARTGIAAFLRSRAPALALTAALLAGTLGYLGAQPQRFEVQNDYAAVFIEMLPHSPDPARDLRDLGLPQEWTASSGVPINDPRSVATGTGFAAFTDHAGLRDRLGIYLTQPTRLAGMLGRGLQEMHVLRAGYIYSYPESAGRGPRASECRVCVLQTAWQATFVPPVIVLALLGCLAVCAVTWSRRAAREARAVGAAGVVLATGVITQFWVVMLTEGASDQVKHLVFANLMLAMLLVVTGACVNCLRTYPAGT